MNGRGHLNHAAVLSPMGAARLCQLTLGCTVISLAVHTAGYSATYGTFCMAVWGSCFALTGAVLVLDVTRLHACFSVSWGNATVTFASLALLLTLTASVLYPAFSLSSECPRNSCETRNVRIAVTVCSCAACVAYGVEVHLARVESRGYMATACGILKVAQSFTGCLIFGLLRDFSKHVGTVFCVVVFGLCLGVTVLLVVLSVSGRTAVLPLPFGRFLAVYAFVAVLLYLGAAIVWPIFCFSEKYGDPQRPQGCPRGKCSWDMKFGVSLLCFINLALYAADLVCSQRRTSAWQNPRV